jgi:hypothetical protein
MKQTYTLIILVLTLLCSCNKENTGAITQGSVYIINEGGFQHGNASISVYDPTAKTISNNVFSQENGFSLGDVAQSMYMIGDTAFIVMNNSAKVVVADAAHNFKYLYSINIPLSSPRFFLPVGGSKAYVSELYANKIWVVDYRLGTVIKTIPVSGSTEHMLSQNGKIYVQEQTNPGTSPVHAIFQIDPNNDQIINTLPLLTDPSSMVIAPQNKLIVLAPHQSAPAQNASLYSVDLSSFSIDKRIDFNSTRTPNFLRYSSLISQILFSDSGGIYTMNPTDTIIPSSTFIHSNNWNVYGLNADPTTGDIYISDAVDYQQASHIMRYSKDGTLIDNFTAGIISNGFIFK